MKMILLLRKTKNISSFNFINNFKKTKGFKKIGHCGTLDPLATGLLIVATDEDTKLIDYLDQKDKTYVARAKLGFETTTYDSEGEIINQSSNVKFTKEKLIEVLNSFIGLTKQMPPKYSAKKLNGIRAYDLARQNIDFELNEVEINITKIKLLSYNEDENYFDFEVVVSRGTYIRSLIYDIGIKLNSLAYMESLERTKIGNLFLEKNQDDKILNAKEIIQLEIIQLEKNQIENLSKGLLIDLKNEDNFYALFWKDEMIGFGQILNNVLKSKKLIGKKIQKILGDKQSE
ncbi:tRNA pseudouridine synthase B [Mycoplasma mobile 163K]|uniref:tRNA pseudouridine synthase B n=2 Tax=[Mycoplasma] mobile TaxID=2118 RepID=TRUB_MYCM1|nr:RecName: Full=tRNA pseudouridine synthase B; AltName: Full=tRNA pseudouridine(55) synthase; Short=Psi55 synthase; AltName: Full=tRNA pseudouridylate synthase; AltName: Full=tRNA-uridine isomerase [Mycoplasma mobile 163K]AAT27952.1 tRNA pseudouridine synthase B [Mycoplasma mobile 163K]